MEPPISELVPCNLCGSTRSTVLFADTVLAPDGSRGVVRCRDCALVYRNIRLQVPPALASYRHRRYEDPSDDWIEGRIRAFQPFAETLDRYRENGRILDVGAGHGFFLHMCAGRGWDCHGIELSTECAAFAARRFGLRYEYGTLEDARYPDALFDVVTCWNVLDQLPDPKAAARRIHRLLRPGGLVLVRCPNAGFHVPARRALRLLSRISARIAGLDQSVFHLHSFDRRTLSALLDTAGFADIEVAAADLGWTTTHAAVGTSGKSLILGTVAGASSAIHALTAGRVLLAPSLLASARRAPWPGPDGRGVDTVRTIPNA